MHEMGIIFIGVVLEESSQLNDLKNATLEIQRSVPAARLNVHI